MSPPLFLVLVLVWAVGSSAVSVLTPIENQRPLVARVSEPYSWSISAATFKSSDGNLDYDTSNLPPWMSFDASSLRFHGTPGLSDQGSPQITVTARDGSGSSASSKFYLCVTSYPAPELHIPLESQFYGDNPALSSVFTLSPNSALATPNPALRIPPHWSFSIGFQYDTFTAPHNLFYDAALANGADLPSWMEWNEKSLTLNGVVPSDQVAQSPYFVSLQLFGSDQEGYQALALPFDIVIAADEFSLAGPLPTINVTANAPFNTSFLSPDDFNGALIDGKNIAPGNVTALDFDTSAYDWLHFDLQSRLLSGNPPNNFNEKKLVLPLVLTVVNQSLNTNVSLAFVPSYFSSAVLPPLILPDDGTVKFDLDQYFSNATSDQRADVTLSAAYDSLDGAQYISFDPNTGLLSGTVPEDCPVSHFDVAFTAYSHKTHSTSHASLSISTSPSKGKKAYTHPVNLSATAHRKLVLALGIAFGVIGGICLLGAVLSAFNRLARVDDTALSNEQGWTANEKRWYGVADPEKGLPDVPRGAMDLNPFGSGAQLVTPVRPAPKYGPVGLGLRRVSERSGSEPLSSPQSPGFMRKAEFLDRIRQTVRNVSEKYGSRGKASRPAISKPRLVVPESVHIPYGANSYASDPFHDSNGMVSYPGSTVMTNSPSTSTGEHSIPRRRADFAPPRAPAAAHVGDGLVRKDSTSSLDSEEEGIVHVASKATSLHSGTSHHDRPRLVPFTSATRVPVPRVPSLTAGGLSGSSAVRKSQTPDELSEGFHYVRTLGGDDLQVAADPSTPSISTNVRSSFSSLESSHHGHSPNPVIRNLVRAGEKFKFRVNIQNNANGTARLEAKLVSGQPLPRFLHVNLTRASATGSVEFYGAPGARDMGEYDVGVFSVENGLRVGRAVIEVVGTSR